MSAVRQWLEEIGLGQYADAFEANDIDTDLLSRLDDQLLSARANYSIILSARASSVGGTMRPS